MWCSQKRTNTESGLGWPIVVPTLAQSMARAPWLGPTCCARATRAQQPNPVVKVDCDLGPSDLVAAVERLRPGTDGAASGATRGPVLYASFESHRRRGGTLPVGRGLGLDGAKDGREDSRSPVGTASWAVVPGGEAPQPPRCASSDRTSDPGVGEVSWHRTAPARGAH